MNNNTESFKGWAMSTIENNTELYRAHGLNILVYNESMSTIENYAELYRAHRIKKFGME